MLFKFKPLLKNLSLKKRKDDSLFVSLSQNNSWMLKSGSNTVSIHFDSLTSSESQNYRIFVTAHLTGVYLVRHLEHKELIKDI